ncbi:DUF4328 domain-containing protein, partial [Streptomyces sp. NPDC057543]|uniref:DUF4328 domain-containing protein n=1 Tax=Streptomyces sp. NPDC057543 TaxID=3346163 RepID=UPI0036C9EEFA
HAPHHDDLWWGAWVCSLAFSRVTSRQYMRAEKTQEIIDAAGLVMASGALGIVAAVSRSFSYASRPGCRGSGRPSACIRWAPGGSGTRPLNHAIRPPW